MLGRLKSKKLLAVALSPVLVIFLACEKSSRSFSILADSNTFKQESTTAVQKKYDILWVVDNSGSMKPFQDNLVRNFNSFIQSFVTLGYDYQIAVTTSDAYLALPQFRNQPSLADFRDGLGTVHTGYPILDMNTPNVLTAFTINASVGGAGGGDERAFSSMKAAMQNPTNARFLRPGAYLAVIILSDEDDFSDPTRAVGAKAVGGTRSDHDYLNPHLETVDSYVAFLDQATGSTAEHRNYNVSAVTVKDAECLRIHPTMMGTRYIDLVNKTGGVLADICSADYASALDEIQARIIELGSEFPLTREPNPDTIQIHTNGVFIPQGTVNGWTYNAANISIKFHGTAIPPQGADISVAFDPLAPR